MNTLSSTRLSEVSSASTDVEAAGAEMAIYKYVSQDRRKKWKEAYIMIETGKCPFKTARLRHLTTSCKGFRINPQAKCLYTYHENRPKYEGDATHDTKQTSWK
jgi:hypothetical protein